MTTATTLVVLFCIATAIAIAVRHVHVPYTVALVVAGLAIGSTHVVTAPPLTKDLLFTIFLPGLLFEAAFHIESAVFRKMWVAIAALAIPGVVVGIGITSVLVMAALHSLSIVPSFSWNSALVFAAIVAATDPVAVTALFRQLSAPAELLVLVEGESLLNDGTSIVFLSLILSLVIGGPWSATGLTASFVLVAGGGAAVGLAVGYVATHVIRRIDDAMIEIAVTMIVAYGSFALAEDLHVSGVIATVVAGMVCGRYGHAAMSERTHRAAEFFWEYVAFALNSVIFLLIGSEVSIAALLDSWREIGVAYVAVLLARAAIVFGGRALWHLVRPHHATPFPLSWSVVLVWGGLRGALSMVLALSLGVALTQRSLVVTMTTGVVLLTLLVQGLTMAPLLRGLGLTRTS